MATRRRWYSPVARAPSSRPDRPTLKAASRWGTESGRARRAAVVATAKSGTATATLRSLGSRRTALTPMGARIPITSPPRSAGADLGAAGCRGRDGEVGDGDGHLEVLGFEAHGAHADGGEDSDHEPSEERGGRSGRGGLPWSRRRSRGRRRPP